MSLSRLLLYLTCGRRLPVTSGELHVRGPAAPITIRRDKWGVPHIDAESEADGYFAAGFCQGQDRAGQLEVLWRLVRGRMAEWVGAAGLVADRTSRRIGFRRAAEAQLKALSTEVRSGFEAFAAGINVGIREGLPKLPHEFAILGGTPSPWDAADVLGVIKLQSFLLPSNWDVELARLRILLADGVEQLKALDPVGDIVSRESLSTPAILSPLARLAADLEALQAYIPRGGGSNNWVIAGSRTESGKPILACDPHLAAICPPPWYLLHIRTPQWEATGATLAGTPGVAVGHNGFCAWGITAALTDNTDFFLETLGPDGKSVRQPDGSFLPCESVTEVIRVKGKPDVVEEVLLTPRGPLLSPTFTNIPLALSLSACWLEPRTLVGFFGAPAARSFDQFRAHFSAWPVMPLNLVYADLEGTIARQVVGDVPIRRGGSGLLPRPADLPDSGWNGTVPFESLPFETNPECGFLATANDDPFQPGVRISPVSSESETAHGQDSSRPWLGADFIDDYRARRIRERLAARETGWTTVECTDMQRDVYSIPWREMRDQLLSLSPTHPEAREALALLENWDGHVDSESSAAAVFEVFVAEMCVRVAKSRAPNSWQAVVGKGGLAGSGHNLFVDRRVAQLSRLIVEQPPGWFASWPAVMEATLVAVMQKLRRTVGPGSSFWSWGHARPLVLKHPLFGKNRWLRGAFNRGPIPCGGDANTISQAAVRHTDPLSGIHNMANLRAVFNLADLAQSSFVLAGGQSGNPLSPNHADQLPLWQHGEAITPAWDQASVIRAAVDTLRLLPAQSSSGG